ncbi:MAG: hypothetical protein P8M25_14860 [Paracoccaceae bacterium]|nr:hypothetical protein [Paracoccaceae bacterium]
MNSVFALGFVLGLQHAVEADHMVAVAAITRNSVSRIMALTQGTAWGLGHTLALLILVLTVVATGTNISHNLSQWIELGVGVMLMFLGLRVLMTAKRKRIHIHFHRHDEETLHIHAHQHTASESADHDSHLHIKPIAKLAAFPILIGLVHGIAGSAALIVFLAASSLTTLWQAVVYVMLFGLGSILGMAAMSTAFSLPVGWLQKKMPSGTTKLSMGIGACVFCIGIHRCLIFTLT